MREDYDDSLEGPIFDEQTGAPLNVRPLWPPLPAPKQNRHGRGLSDKGLGAGG